jgi:ribosomal protein S27AE
MANCNLCKKKVSWLTAYNVDDKYFCDDCWKKRNDKIENQKAKEESKGIETKKEDNKIMEYKRKCNQCGKIWHSLVGTEKHIKTQGILQSIVGVGTALTGNLGASTQSNRNANAGEEWLSKLKKCPNCGSSDYTEEIITFKKKK